jgi:hypothetical protein
VQYRRFESLLVGHAPTLSRQDRSF